MKVLVDACVLFPTVLRELVVDVAATGAFEPCWSTRILEEWRRAASRRSDEDARIAGVEIALLKDRFPTALVDASPVTEARLALPDPGDIHVLAAAIDGGARELLTLNLKDFPTNVLGAEGILRRHPDEFLLECHSAAPKVVAGVVHDVLGRAASHGIDTSNRRSLLKKARLPRFGKALDQD